MSRTTVVIPPALRRRAQLHARAQGKSLSQFIREKLAESIAPKAHPARARSRFFRRQPQPGAQPAARDVALNHDDYLYGDQSEFSAKTRP